MSDLGDQFIDFGFFIIMWIYIIYKGTMWIISKETQQDTPLSYSTKLKEKAKDDN